MSDYRKSVSWSLKIEGIEQALSGAWILLGRLGADPFADRIARLGLADRYRSAYRQTDPVYYGWFIESPLTVEQVELLRTLVVDIIATSPDNPYDYGLVPLKSALTVAAAVPSATLTVQMSRPGHADFGMVTIYCHCPQCKAPTAGLQPWPDRRWRKANPDVDSAEHYPTEPVDCTVCGFRYSPASTYSSTGGRRKTPVKCLSCYASVEMDQFRDEEITAINRHESKVAFLAEARTIRLAIDFIRRHRLDEARFSSTNREALIEELTARGETEAWSSADLSLIHHFKRQGYLPSARLGFVEGRIADIEDTIIICPNCHG